MKKVNPQTLVSIPPVETNSLNKESCWLKIPPVKSARTASSAAKQERAKNGVQNRPAVPSYMAATESAKAKLKAQGLPRLDQDGIENHNVSRRHSLPASTNKKTKPTFGSLAGDCKTLMYVQISPSAADLGETLCSLNFASRVRGMEHGPARKQADLTELVKYKQLAEKAKHDEKEMKKLQDSLQSLQLRLGSTEHFCRSVRDLENQLAKERKTRLKQETRALAAVSAQSPALSALNQAQKTIAEKKPPLGPSRLRLPLRRITNFLPPPAPHHKTSTPTSSILPVSTDDKENISNTTKTKASLKARRGSIAVRPPPPATNPDLTNANCTICLRYQTGEGCKVVLSTLAFTAFELPPNGAIGTRILEFLFHSRPDLVNIRSVDEAIVIGAALSLSSSAFVLQYKDRELGDAHAEIKALKYSERVKEKAVEELTDELNKVDEKLKATEALLESKNLEIKKINDEKKAASAAQFAAEATLRRVHAA
ncbi:unnamed protein product [Camellia sinensis]